MDAPRARQVLAGALAAWIAVPALAEDYAIRIVDMPLDIVLTVVGRDLGMEFSVDAPARMRLRDLSLSGPPEAVFADLMDEVGMDHFAFNGQTHVSPSGEREVRLVRLNGLSPELALTALDEAGLLLDDFPVSEVAGGSALVLSGPIKFLAISEGVLAALDPPELPGDDPIRVRRAGRIDTEGAALSVSDTAPGADD